MTPGGLDRRSLLVGAGASAGALTLSFAIPLADAEAHAEVGACEINCWIVVAPDDTVTIRVARSEMGQGAMTGLAMLVAEEFECDWSKVHTEFVSPAVNLSRNRIWGDTSTGASRSIASSQNYLRRAGATAREMLVTAAAAWWQVPTGECVAANSVITHRPSGRTVTFGAIAAARCRSEGHSQAGLRDRCPAA
jgi:isoquinoline 1-oxidoreductase beta subunit